MNRFSTLFVALLAAALFGNLPAAAMDQASTPPKFSIPWGNSAGSSYIRSIPVPSQIGTQNCAASLTDGFPPLTFVPAGAGGCPPFGSDFNGILKQVTQGVRWYQAGGPIYYDSAFATGAGGYPAGTIIQSAIVPGNQWMSTADGNTNDPDNGGANWVQAPGQVPTGTPVASLVPITPTGYVAANGLAIGDASSNATGRANADTKFLFALVWTNCPGAQCPIFTSAGGGSSRGVSADADFAAHKALVVWKLTGTGLIGVDTMAGSPTTFLAGVPVTSGSTTVPGSILGENLHSLTGGENGSHTHANTLNDPGHTHANTLNDPGHTHSNTLTDPGHVHTNTITDSGHTHSNTLTDPGHVHSVPITDPGHAHSTTITQNQFNISAGAIGPFLYGATIGGGVSAGTIIANTTGITASASSHATGMSINNASATTGITSSAQNHATGMSINNASQVTGQTINNVSQVTGQSINNVSSGSGTGHNTVERSMLVYWNLKL